jgi:hypothetical protein
LRTAATATSGSAHGLLDHRQQLGAEGIQVELVPQVGAERLDRLGGVLAASVEAAVNRLLDAAAGRLEHGRDRQGGPGHDQAGVPAEQLAQSQHHRGVAPAQQQVSSP